MANSFLKVFMFLAWTTADGREFQSLMRRCKNEHFLLLVLLNLCVKKVICFLSLSNSCHDGGLGQNDTMHNFSSIGPWDVVSPPA